MTEIREWHDNGQPVYDIDLNKLDWQILDNLASAGPMQHHQLRERLRQLISEVARVHNMPRLAVWAARLTPANLDYLAHFGFLESHFFQGLTGDVGTHGWVRFTGPRNEPWATDGAHRVPRFDLN